MIRFAMAERSEAIEVFTTRPDTIFGVSFVTLAPEHELIEKITPAENRAEVMAYAYASQEPQRARTPHRCEEGERRVHRSVCEASVHASRCAGLGR